jgi:polyketide biosynthesis acyl carrier protein
MENINSTAVFELIVRNLKQIISGLENEHIERNAMLSPLGADSIGRAELIEQTLEDLDLHVSRSEFHAASNLGELADIFAQKIAEAKQK